MSNKQKGACIVTWPFRTHSYTGRSMGGDYNIFYWGLPRSGGKDIILIIIDKLTKYCHLLALSHSFKATTVAELFCLPLKYFKSRANRFK
jgi:hypothetical protein